MELFIVDASVFNKLFLEEADSPLARNFFLFALEGTLALGAPEFLKLEACKCAVRSEIDVAVPLDFFEMLDSGTMTWFSVSKRQILEAQRICHSGTRKTGYPKFIDSMYHAIAILHGGVLLTADRNHARRAGNHGHLVLLEDWAPNSD